MNIDHNKNIEQSIDDLCENLVWTWAYFRVINGLHIAAKSFPESLVPYPQLISCLYHGLFDVLFIKIYNFIDPSKEARGFPKLFKLLRKYLSDNTNLMAQVKNDEERFKKEENIEKIKKWRHEVTAHLTQSFRDQSFFSSNRLHLTELEELLKLLEKTLENYSFILLQRFNDTQHPSKEIESEIEKLLNRSTAEQISGEG
jgi:hypothetical protein